MEATLEAIPNVSAARDQDAVRAVGDALGSHARILDVHSDIDHDRTVYTAIAPADRLVRGLYSAVETAVESIDLRRHRGVHPRIGAVDVIPIVPLGDDDENAAKATARTLAKLLASDLGMPVFFYGGLSTDGHGPAFFRRGGLDELAERLKTGDLEPDEGPAALHPTAGAVLVGVRGPLIAFNVNLAGADLGVAREIARSVRERDGGLQGIRALGLEIESAGTVQVSTNIEDWEATPPHRLLRAIEDAARRRGARVSGAELVGLLPAGAALAAAARPLALDELAARQVLELRLLEAMTERSRQAP
ncbi:MAG: glutamate formimidoyltransferase [Gaiellales bacterium]